VDRETLRADLIAAFRHAVDGEHRFGIRSDTQDEMVKRWSRVLELLEQLCRKK